MNNLGGRLILTVLLAGALLVGACQSPSSTTGQLDSVDAFAPAVDSAELAYDLALEPWCTNNQAASMILLLVDGQDGHNRFDQRLLALDSRDLARANWNLEAEEPVTKGTLAFMVCRALDIEGGLLMRVMPSRRYAYREAVYARLMSAGSSYEPVTGPEAVGIFSRAARYRQNEGK